MSFVSRARISSERGDTLRAVLTLVAGLRRTPDTPDAVELLTELVAERVESGGIEHEIADVVARQPNADDVLSAMVNGLLERERERVADTLRSEGEKRGVRYIPPPEPEPEPEPEPDSEPEIETETDESIDDAEGDSAPEVDESAEVEVPAAEAAEAVEPSEPEMVTDDVMTRRKRERIEQRQAEEKAKQRRRFTRVLVVALLVGFAAVGYYAYESMSRSGDLATLDAEIHAFNRFDESPVDSVKSASGLRRAAPFTERIAFAESLAGQAVPEGDYETEWGHAAAAVSSASRGDVEAAIRSVTRLERLYSDSLPVYFARARLAEARGDFESARNEAQMLLDRHGDFLPAHEVVVRAAARQFQFDRLDAAVAQIVEIDVDHPYATLGGLPSAREVLLGSPSAAATEENPTKNVDDPFVRAAAAYAAAVRHATNGDAGAASTSAARAVMLDGKFGPGYLIEAASAAAAGDPELAAERFTAAAKWATAGELRHLIQTVAPIALAGAGRADLAARFTTPYPKLRGEGVDDTFDADVGGERPEALRKPALPDATQPGLAADALFARLDVMRASGDYDAALAFAADLHRRGIQPGRANVVAREMELALGRKAEREATEPLSQRLVAALEQQQAGDFSAVLSTEWGELPDWAVPLRLELMVLSMLPMRKTGDAMELLDRTSIGLAYRPRLSGLRLRALGRLGQENAAYESLHEQFAARPPNTVPRLLDLAAGAFWQGNVKETEARLDAARKLAPEHREVAWLCGLVNRARNRLDEAAACFDASGRDYDETAGLLIELGHVQAQIGNWDEARKMFHKALMRERLDLEAARGLGEAYTYLDDALAVRDLERIRSGYGAESPDSAVRGELTKWLAVVQGVRNGEEAGLSMLEEAAQLLGERDDVLLERARYHGSREEWDQAKLLYQSALKGNATLASAHIAIARIEYRLGNPDGATMHLERYLELEPRGRSASWARRQLDAK